MVAALPDQPPTISPVALRWMASGSDSVFVAVPELLTVTSPRAGALTL